MTARKKKIPLWLTTVLVLVLMGLFSVIALLLPTQEDAQVLRPSVPDVVFEDFPTAPAHPDLDSEPDTKPTTHQQADVATPTQKQGHGVALIIDDVGYDLEALRRILALNVPVAISILPDSPHSERAAEISHQAGQMVMLHLPMEPDTAKYRDRMDASFLRADMSPEQLRQVFMRDLSHVPFVEGVNNHMGSHLTRMHGAMDGLMKVIGEEGLFFVDSKTSGKSVAAAAAEHAGLAWASRQIFLDHHLDKEYLREAWQKAEACQAEGKACVVIAHPHPETVAFLEQQLADNHKLELKPLRSLLHTQRLTTGMRKQTLTVGVIK